MNAKDILEKAQKSIDEYVSAAKNSFADFSQKLKGKFQSKKAGESQEQDSTENVAQSSDDSDTTKKDSSATETKDTAQNNQAPTSLGLTIALAILDIIASLVFVAAIVIAIKPSLLTDAPFDQLYKYTSFAEKIGDTLIKVEAIQDKIPKNTKILQACATGLGLIIFGLLKIVVLLTAKSGSKKIVSALTLAMTYLACFMMSDKFLLFSIFILLLYFTFSYSCGFSTPAVLVKFGVVVVSTIVIYVTVHFAIDPSLPKAAQKIFTALRLPILHW
ncbi:MAG: hypothetical protein J6V90_07505 [Treponema sp.]|nr:hypothetical protein [Treponema sp.]